MPLVRVSNGGTEITGLTLLNSANSGSSGITLSYSAEPGDYILAVSGRTGRNVATGISATNATVLTTGNISDTGKLLFARANGNGTVSASWQSNQTYNGYLGIYKVNFA